MRNINTNEFTLDQIRSWAKSNKYTIKIYEHKDGDYATCSICFDEKYIQETGTDYYWMTFVLREDLDYFQLVDACIKQVFYEKPFDTFDKESYVRLVNKFLNSQK